MVVLTAVGGTSAGSTLEAYRAIAGAMYEKPALAVPLQCFDEALRFLLLSAELLFQDGVIHAVKDSARIPWTAAEEAAITALVTAIPLNDSGCKKLFALDLLRPDELVRRVTRALLDDALDNIAQSSGPKEAATVKTHEAKLTPCLRISLARTAMPSTTVWKTASLMQFFLAQGKDPSGRLPAKFIWLLEQVHGLGFRQKLAELIASQEWLAGSSRLLSTATHAPSSTSSCGAYSATLRRGASLEASKRSSFLLLWVPTLAYVSCHRNWGEAMFDKLYADTSKVLSTFSIKEQADTIIELMNRTKVQVSKRHHLYGGLWRMLLNLYKIYS
eukprot:SM000024S07801  [mRNA]  locus=s24:505409:506419:+ [translate_table: standard]